ncbi:MAG: glycosyltransferase [Clostridia bacterium]|nr:glycosyltransferase [Clostridia bacterium]
MKILQINTVDAYGSTGKIARGIYDECKAGDIECKIAHRYNELKTIPSDSVAISTYFDCHVHNRLARITHLTGCFSRIKTVKFLRWVKRYSPDIIHLHNLHGNFINVPMLFRYIKKSKTPLIWTLHDCWSFTGGCPHFTMVGCDGWKKGCGSCTQIRHPDVTRFLWRQKKKWFCGVENATIVTPSEWLANEVRESFLKDYPIKVIGNGIDLDVFSPQTSDFREKYNCMDKKIILGVAFDWGERKGLDIFIELAGRLDEAYQIVLVGTNEKIDDVLPNNIISIHRTKDQQELAEIYSAADLFLNPTREDTYPTVNMEALACGTPVLTFRTGGSPEIIDENCGTVVEVDDIDAVEREIIRICEEKPFSREACLNRSRIFDKKMKFKEYVELYLNKTKG